MELTTPARVGIFATGLVALFATALGVGNAVGPVVDPPPTGDEAMAEHAGEGADSMAGGGEHGGEHLPGGLMVSQDGYTLELAATRLQPGSSVPLAFTVTDDDGAPLTSYDVEHEKQLHLIVVRRDGTGFQHVHPELDATSGEWSTDVALSAGPWRVLADFVPAGADEGITLGADLAVAGDFEPVQPPDQSRTSQVGDYTVTIEGDLVAGEDADLTLTVEKDGQPVTDLQPYLGANGHLVALRDGDLAYLHVHPEDDGTAGPEIGFVAEVPSAGRYFLYLDFLHGDVVRTATFTLEASR
jgi:hypothetical protein